MKNETMRNAIGTFVRNHWLMLLIVIQPLLDVLAFWTKSPDGTLAGYIRLAIMLLLLDKNKHYGLVLPQLLGNQGIPPFANHKADSHRHQVHRHHQIDRCKGHLAHIV